MLLHIRHKLYSMYFSQIHIWSESKKATLFFSKKL